MKWNDEQVAQLKELCYAGVVNRDIAEVIGCHVNDVYNKRSQLGITIAKCKEMEVKPEFDKIFEPVKKGLPQNIKDDFNTLNNSILLAMAGNNTSLKDVYVYAAMSNVLISLETTMDGMLKENE